MKHSVTWPWCHGTNTIFTSNQSLLCEHVAHSILGTDLIKHFFACFMYTRVSQRFWSHHPISSSMSPCILLDEGRSMAASTCDCQWSTWSFGDSKSYRLQCLSKELWLGPLPDPRMLSWQMTFFFFGIWGSKNMIILVVTVSGGQPKWWPMMAGMEIV